MSHVVTYESQDYNLYSTTWCNMNRTDVVRPMSLCVARLRVSYLEMKHIPKLGRFAHAQFYDAAITHVQNTRKRTAPVGKEGVSLFLISLLSLLKNRSRLMRSPCCVPPLINVWMTEPVFMKLGMCIKGPVPISTAYLLNPHHQSVCLYVYPSVVTRQRLGKIVTAATNTHVTSLLLNASFSMRSVSYQRKVGCHFITELVFLCFDIYVSYGLKSVSFTAFKSYFFSFPLFVFSFVIFHRSFLLRGRERKKAEIVVEVD
jgi:hypothetical protein